MTRRAVRLVGGLVGLLASAAVVAVTLAGLVCLGLAVILGLPVGQGQTVAAVMMTAGVALLLLAYGLDRLALRRALATARAVAFRLAGLVASGGRR